MQGQYKPRAETQILFSMSMPRYRLCPATAKAERPLPHPVKLRKHKFVRFCGCKVVRLQNITYLCGSYNKKNLNHEYYLHIPTYGFWCAVDAIPCSYSTAQPHNRTTLLLCGCGTT